jgi:hypothetical protein
MSGLSDTELAQLGEQLADGRRPRVAVRAAGPYGPAGTRATVVSLLAPEVAERVVVRLGADELPFAADELEIPRRRPRGAPAEEAPAPRPAAKTSGRAAPPPQQAAPTQPASLAAVPVPAAPAPAAATEPAAAPRRGRPSRPAPPGAPTSATPPPRRTRSATPTVPAFGFTVRFDGAQWTLEASAKGGKRSTPAAVSLAAVRAFADRLDDVEIRRQILAGLDTSRRLAEQRAQQLQAELDEIAVLLAQVEES